MTPLSTLCSPGNNKRLDWTRSASATSFNPFRCLSIYLMLFILQKRVHGYLGWSGSWFLVQSPPSVSTLIPIRP